MQTGLVVNAEDSQSEPWSSDVGLNPGFTSKLDGKDGPSTWWQKNNENNKDSQKISNRIQHCSGEVKRYVSADLSVTPCWDNELKDF